MAEWLAPLITSVRNAGPVIYAAAFAASLAILFLPDKVANQIGLLSFREDYRAWVGVALIASGSLLLAYASAAVLRGWNAKQKTRRYQRATREALRDLTKDEKAFLRPYILDGVNTQQAGMYDGVPNGLRAKGIIYRASQMSVPDTLMEFEWNLQPYARTVLSTDQTLLD